MEQKEKRIDWYDGFEMGDWRVACAGKEFEVFRNQVRKLISGEDENLEKIVFDVEKKTVSVKVKNSRLPEDTPRIVDLSEAPEFFEELRKDIESVLTETGNFGPVTPNADRTVFEISNEIVRIDYYDGYMIGDWGVCCVGKWFDLYKYSIGRLVADEDEDLEKIIFDVEKKTVSVKVKNPTYSNKGPLRTVDLSNAPEFFEELRKDIEMILTEMGTFESVTSNADRTVFEISDKVVRIDSCSGFKMGIWRVGCCGKTFSIGTHDIGAKLAARGDEHLEKVFFDVEKKTVSIKVKIPKLTEPPKRILDLSEAPEFFEELRKNIEMILTEKGTFKSVTPNADRTVFEIF